MKEKSTNMRSTQRAKRVVKAPYKKKIQPMMFKQNIRCLLRTKLKSLTTSHKRINWLHLSKLINEDMCTCAICTQIIIAPVVLDCGHIYCMQCLEEYHETRCSLCRKENADQLELATAVESFICKCVLPYCQDALNYWCRQESYDYSQSKRQVDFTQIKRGDMMDVRDDKNVWRQGLFLNMYKKKDGNNYIALNIGGPDDYQFIHLPTSSRRLASLGFFTNKGYEKYKRPSFLIQMTKSLEKVDHRMLNLSEVF